MNLSPWTITAFVLLALSMLLFRKRTGGVSESHLFGVGFAIIGIVILIVRATLSFN